MTVHRGAVSLGSQTEQTRPAETTETAYTDNEIIIINIYQLLHAANDTTSTTGETHLSRNTHEIT